MSVPKLFVLGASGQVGKAVCALAPHAVPVTRDVVDLSDADTFGTLEHFLRDRVRDHATANAVVLNLAAFTSVDDAESPEMREQVWAVNATAPERVAQLCQHLGLRFIHVSTDYVFSGDVAEGQCNATDDPTGPINEYGRSKLAGEQGALRWGATVVRTSWVYTGPKNTGGDFVKSMVNLANKGVNPSVVADQWGRPTYAKDLAAALVDLASGAVSELPQGVLHIAGSGVPTTWYEFARRIFALAGHDPERVSPIPTADYPTPAARPLNATLCLPGRDGLPALPAWQDSLREVLR